MWLPREERPHPPRRIRDLRALGQRLRPLPGPGPDDEPLAERIGHEVRLRLTARAGASPRGQERAVRSERVRPLELRKGADEAVAAGEQAELVLREHERR